jgi:hypothetical protein
MKPITLDILFNLANFRLLRLTLVYSLDFFLWANTIFNPEY